MATRSPARPCQNGKYFSCATTAVSCAVARARSRTVGASHLRLVVGTVDEALSPLRWEVARTGTELLILLTPAAPMNMDAATKVNAMRDRKSTRLNSSHLGISYAVFCLKKN